MDRQAYHDLGTDLLRAWTTQLYTEFHHICVDFKVRLARPLIRIEDLKQNWGQWHTPTRTLTISRRLIEEQPWDIVTEILKHEMAHQLVAENAWPGSPHGEAFQEACRRLGVATWARQASGELPLEIPDWRRKTLSDDQERLLKRAEKLLALAASTNEHEAAVAMQRVRQLYAKYNLEQMRASTTPSYVYCTIGSKQKRIPAEDTMIFSILSEHFFVQAIFVDRYDAAAVTHFKAVELLGTPENVAMAEYIYHFLVNQRGLLWRDYQRRTGTAGRERRSYMLGLLAGFRDKLKVQATEPLAQADDASSKALMATADQQLKQYLNERFPRLTWSRRGSTYRDSDTFAAGVSDGNSITLHRGVTQSDGNKGLRLADR